MTTHKYELRKYRPNSKGTCPSCGGKKCFTYFVFSGTDEIVRNDLGVCDHKTGCGYKLAPWDLTKDDENQCWKDKGKEKGDYVGTGAPVTAREHDPLIPIPTEYLRKSMVVTNTGIRDCNLLKWLVDEGHIDGEKLMTACIKYYLGVTRSGEVIYWQIDTERKIHTGKIMRYLDNGHRDKSDFGTWIHKKLQAIGVIPLNYIITGNQCLFGTHLLNRDENKGKAIAIVESEKTALVCSEYKPEYVWLATGGLQNLNEGMLRDALATKRPIYLMPDRDGHGEWVKKLATFSAGARGQISVSNWVKQNATDNDASTADILDIMLRQLREHYEGKATAKYGGRDKDGATEHGETEQGRDKPTGTGATGDELTPIEKALNLDAPNVAVRALVERLELEMINK